MKQGKMKDGSEEGKTEERTLGRKEIDGRGRS